MRHVARIGKKRNAYRLLVGKPEGKRPVGRPRCRCVDNIKMDLLEIGWMHQQYIRVEHPDRSTIAEHYIDSRHHAISQYLHPCH
jgi:hypothetical protein